MQFFLLLIFPWPGTSSIQFVIRCRNTSTDTSEFVDVVYTLADFLLAAMFVRVYFVIYALANGSHYFNLYGRRKCHENGFEPGPTFILRVHMYNHPLKTILVILVWVILSVAYILRLFERPYYTALFYGEASHFDTDGYLASVYCVCITITTVGFGDIVPHTPIGRTIIVWVAFTGALIIALIVTTFEKIIGLSYAEQ